MKTYGKLRHFKKTDIDNQEWDYWVLDEMPPHVIIRLKHIFPKISTTARPPIYLNNTLENSHDLKWFMQRYPLEISDDDTSYLNEQSEKYLVFRDENFSLLEGSYKAPTDVGFKDGHELSPFQGTAVHLFHRVKKILIADEVGLGKTVEALGGLMNTDCLPALVVCQ